MIGFHEVRFPEAVSWGTRGGPVYKTQVFTSHRGFEKRNVDWSQPMMKFNAAYGVKNDAQVLEVINFFNARQGQLFGFRFKNWCNYQIIDGPIATGDGFNQRLPIYKFFGFSGNRHYKRLRKIVRGSVTGVQVGNEPVIEGVDFRIDYDSGEIALNNPVGYGIAVRVQTLEFDEPVRFDEDSLENVIEAYNNNSLNSLSLVSIRGVFSAGSVFTPDRTLIGLEDQFYGRTRLLLNFDDTSNLQATADQSAIHSPMTFVGSATLNTKAYRHGSGSLELGYNGMLSTGGAAFAIDKPPFTIEAFAQRPRQGAQYQPLIAKWQDAGVQKSFLLRYALNTERIEFLASTNGANGRIILSHPWETSADFFDHISIDRTSSGWYILRINGLIKRVTKDLDPIYDSTAPLTIGRIPNETALDGSFQGIIDSIRFTIGVARNGNFDTVEIPVAYGVA